ncbi:MAG: hypothetical protein ACYDD4_04270 [Acidimicrobiales bacterium]
MTEVSRVELVVAVNDALDHAAVGHGFGGAIALAYYVAEPRATRDLDVNISVDVGEARRVLESLPTSIAWSDADVDRCQRDGQVRVWSGPMTLGTPVDLFFPQHQFHQEVAKAITRRPFLRSNYTIPIIAPAHLAVFKLLYGRPRDWVDIRAMLEYHAFDPVVVLRWLSQLLDDDHASRRRFVMLAEEVSILPETAPTSAMPEPVVDWNLLNGR